MDNDFEELRALLGEEPTVYVNFTADIWQGSVQELIDVCSDVFRRRLGKVLLMISSTGGNVSDGLHLHNFLKSMPIDIGAHNTSFVNSIANAVYLGAKKRTASKNSTFLFHGVSMQGNFGEADLMRALDIVRKDNLRIAETIAAQTKMTVEELREMFRGEVVLTAQEALEKGIVHEIKDMEIPKDATLFTISERKRK